MRHRIPASLSFRPVQRRCGSRMALLSDDVVLWLWKRKSNAVSFRPQHFLSYCPLFGCPISRAARFVRTLPPLAVEGPKVRPRGVPTFSCCGCGTFRLFRTRSIKSLVANRGTRFTQFMESADKTGSKLFAEVPRHTQGIRLLPSAFAPTWQEEGKSLSVASSPLCRKRHVKTLPVSTPSRLCCAAVSRSWSFRP